MAVLLLIASHLVLAGRCEAFGGCFDLGLCTMLLAYQKEKKAVSRQEKERQMESGGLYVPMNPLVVTSHVDCMGRHPITNTYLAFLAPPRAVSRLGLIGSCFSSSWRLALLATRRA